MLTRRLDRAAAFTRRDAVRLLVAALLLVTGLTAILAIDDLPRAYDLKVGDSAVQAIRAPRTVTYTSAVLTQAAREAASSKVPPQYDYEPDAAASLASRLLDTLTSELDPVDAAFAPNVTPEERKAALDKTLPGLTPEARKTLEALAPERWAVVAGEATRVLGLVQRTELRDSQLDAQRASLDSLFSPQLTDSERQLAVEIVSPLMTPNSTFSQQRTTQAQQAAAQAVTPVTRTFRQGDIVIDAGQQVAAVDVEALAELGLDHASLDLGRLAGWALLAALVVGLFLVWLWRFRQDLWHRGRTLALLGLVLLVTALAYKITGGRSILPFFLPGAGAGMLVAILLGSGPATVVMMFVAILAGTGSDLPLEITTYILVGGLAGIVAVRRGDRFQVFLQAGLAIALANVATVSVFALLGAHDVTGALQLFGASVVAAAGSSVATVGTFAVVGNLFGILTTFQLLELASPSQPLLRRLLLETPGTYHHSLMVGNLAERAAERIGADALLARVAAYYHDVGKLTNPLAFIENQAGVENVHEELPPEVSAQMLKAHVADGIEIAYKARLPRPLIAFIPQHHGTALMSYFWAKARDEVTERYGGPDTVAGRQALEQLDERRFRHNGPKPQSKEAAILMLADGVEASVRSLSSHDEPTISAMVNRIISERLHDGQFDECALTLGDLEKIRRSFVAQLLGVYHQRIAYPQNKVVELEARRGPGAAGAGGTSAG